MTKMSNDNREAAELTTDELDTVSGGFKWQLGTKNPDVIDARGGEVHFGSRYTVTLDANGKGSSITHNH